MERALYFPHTTPRDDTILKEALLLWDELEFIIPWEGYDDPHADRDTRAALEIIGRPITPNVATKRRVHKRIENLIGRGLPSKYLFYPGTRSAPIFADKLARDTWNMLLRGKIIGDEFRLQTGRRSASTYELAEPLALAIMTILADECAGKTALKVTDAPYASDADAAYLTRDLGGDLGRLEPDHETCVVTLPVPIIPMGDLSLKQLTEIRASESAFLRGLRHNYRKEVDRYIADLSGPNTSEHDMRRAAEGFTNGMRDDLVELDRMLNRRFKIADYNICEVIGRGLNAAIVTYAASTSSLAAFLAGVGSIGFEGYFKLMGSIPLNEEKREEILKKNRAAWLYHVREATGA